MVARHIALAAGLGLSVLSLACSAPAAAPPTGQQAASMQPKTGGYLRHLLPYSPQNLDPYTTDNPTGYGFIVRQWYEPLVSIEFQPGVDWRIEGKVVPWLAESWKLESDGKNYTLRMRKGIKFHSGDDLTVDDVVFSYSRFTDPNEKISPSVRADVENLQGVERVDGDTVRVIGKRPDPDFLGNLASFRVPILSKKFYESGTDVNKQTNGTGPFKLVSYRKDAEGLAVRHEQYWQQGRPYLDGIKHTLLVDDSTMGAAFASGNADILMRNDKNQFLPLQAVNPSVQFAKEVVNQLYSVNFNVGRPPLDDVRVRRAMLLALDRQELDRSLTFEEGTHSAPLVPVIKTGWSMTAEEIARLPGYRASKDQDLAEAKKLLAEAGYPTGFKTSIRFQQGFGYTPQASEAVQTQFKNLLGVDAEIIPHDNATYLQRRVRGEFDLVVEASSTVDRPSTYAWSHFHSEGGQARGASVKDAELDRLIEAQSNEFDHAKRGRHFIAIQKHLLEKAYTIPLPQAMLYAAWQPWVHDWVSNKGNRQSIMNPWALWMDVESAPPDRRQQ